MNSTAYGERNAITADTETREILRWSVARSYREPSYKPQGEMRGDAVGEVGGGHISVEGRDNTTWPEERASTFIVLSGEVSDDACRKRPTPSDR
jgi:hypothetical protein